MLWPGGGQLYAQDWALGIYLASLGVVAGSVWEFEQPVVALLIFLLAWFGGLVLVPLSLRKDADRGL